MSYITLHELGLSPTTHLIEKIHRFNLVPGAGFIHTVNMRLVAGPFAPEKVEEYLRGEIHSLRIPSSQHDRLFTEIAR